MNGYTDSSRLGWVRLLICTKAVFSELTYWSIFNLRYYSLSAVIDAGVPLHPELQFHDRVVYQSTH